MNATFAETRDDGSETYVYVMGKLVLKRWNWPAWVSGGKREAYSRLFQTAPSTSEVLIEFPFDEKLK